MKSLKYSSLSKMKKQKQQQKNTVSVLNTLKQDDQICSNLLDTLSDDYLGYLENLMGKQVINDDKKSNKNNRKINSYQAKVIQDRNQSRKAQPQQQDTILEDKLQEINLNQKQIDIKLCNNNKRQKNSNNSTKQFNQKINPNKQTIKLQNAQSQEISNKKISNNKHSQIYLENVKTEKNQQVEQSSFQPKKCFKSQKQKSKLKKIDINAVKRQSENREQKNNQQKIQKQKSSHGKILIKNIERYLQSLNKIDSKASLVNQANSQLDNITKFESKNIIKNFHKRTKRTIQQQDLNQISKRTKRAMKNENNNKEYQKNTKSSKDPLKQKKQKYYQKESIQSQFVKVIKNNKKIQQQISVNSSLSQNILQKSLSSSNFSDQIHITPNYNQNNIQNQRKQQNLISSNSLKNPNHHQQNPLNRQSFLVQQSFKIPSPGGLQQLLINIITKYNKILSKQYKYKQKIDQLTKQCIKLQQLNEFKDFQIESLKSQVNINIQNLNFEKKTKSKQHKNNHDHEKNYDLEKLSKFFNSQQGNKQIDSFNQNYLQKKLTDSNINNIKINHTANNKILQKQEFVSNNNKYKDKLSSGKNINIQKMISGYNNNRMREKGSQNIGDNNNGKKEIKSMEIFRKQKSNRKISKQTDFLNLSLKNQNKTTRENEKQKRSVSCRQNYRKFNINEFNNEFNNEQHNYYENFMKNGNPYSYERQSNKNPRKENKFFNEQNQITHTYNYDNILTQNQKKPFMYTYYDSVQTSYSQPNRHQKNLNFNPYSKYQNLLQSQQHHRTINHKNSPQYNKQDDYVLSRKQTTKQNHITNYQDHGNRSYNSLAYKRQQTINSAKDRFNFTKSRGLIENKKQYEMGLKQQSSESSLSSSQSEGQIHHKRYFVDFDKPINKSKIHNQPKNNKSSKSTKPKKYPNPSNISSFNYHSNQNDVQSSTTQIQLLQKLLHHNKK